MSNRPEPSGKSYDAAIRSVSNPYLQLVNAIILRAVYDYRYYNALNHIRERPEYTREIQSLERFFLSDWFTLLTDADGAVIIERLESEPVTDDYIRKAAYGKVKI